jgi:photosystem II stability/assembly factor-like uncharacterized protein
MVKKVFYILFFFLFPLAFLYPQWQWQNPLPQGNNLSSIMYINENTIWASVSGGGSLLKSSDGGENWKLVILPERLFAEDVFFVNENVGWTCGQLSNVYPDNFLIGTKDGGETWQVQLVDSAGLFNSIVFANEHKGWVSGEAARIFHTTNGGDSWELQANFDGDILSLELVDSLHLWAPRQGGAGTPLLHTTNGGTDWIVDSSVTWSYDACFLDTLNGWISGKDKIAKTTDGGNTWEIQLDMFPVEWTDIFMDDENHGWAISYSKIAHTTNGGDDWIVQDNPSEYGLWGLSFKDSLQGFVVGSYGTILKTVDGAINWIDMTHRVTPSSLTDVYFINTTVGWITGREGTILKTTNSGNNWTELTTNTYENLKSIIFISEDEGMAVGENGTIILSTDGGYEWLPIQSPSASNWNSIDFSNYPEGWIVGGDALTQCKLAKSTNGGLNWTEFSGVSLPAGSPEIQFTSREIGWIMVGNTTIGGQQKLYKTTDGGDIWETVLSNNSDSSYLSMYFISDEVGWISTFPSSTLFHTTDCGISWQRYLTTDRFNSIFFIDSLKGWGSATSGEIYLTTDAGKSWNPQSCPVTLPVEIFFIDENIGWIAGVVGRILHTTNGGVTNVDSIRKNSLPENFILYQNYPNPFNPLTRIKFEIPTSSVVILKIYDVLGMELKTLVNGFRNAGSYEVEFDGSEFPSGVYFYRLTSGQFTSVKKLILLK